jgi:hypothetical protein
MSVESYHGRQSTDEEHDAGDTSSQHSNCDRGETQTDKDVRGIINYCYRQSVTN